MEELGPDVVLDLAARRSLLRDIFSETLHTIDVRSVFQRAVHCEDGVLRATDLAYRLFDYTRIIVIAIGKPAVPSAEVVLQQICGCKQNRTEVQALVVGPGDLRCDVRGIEHWQGSHPFPDATSRIAACRIVALLRNTTTQDLVLFLISGGASAMVELPLDESVTTEEIADFYRTLVHSGLTIAEINTLRKHLSAVKGGRLAQFAADATKCTLLISDVPDEMADVIGSGPTLPDSSTREQCGQLMQRPELKNVPSNIRALLESKELAETPKEGAECFRQSQTRVVLSTSTMLAAAAESCRRKGFHVVIDNTCDDWDYREAAEYLLQRARLLSAEHSRLCLLSGGEVAVEVSGDPGRGGRNQQLALYCASLLHREEAISILSAGTDGIDGNSPAAGGVVDATTVERARHADLDVLDALKRFDAFPLLERIGDAIITSPTGNNVRDLRIVMAARS